jgi:hypothetical protein
MTRIISYDFCMTTAYQLMMPIAIHTAQGVRVAVRVTGDTLRG